MSRITVETLGRHGREAALDDLARLRIAVFLEWPYLYDGSLDYERRYLTHFIADEAAIMVIARDGAAVVGMATASPMSGQDVALRASFERLGHDISRLFYFGESVLLPDYRGQGVGHAFFDQREAAARNANAATACFCGVVRPPDHPLRPADARDLGPFWRARGYQPVEGAVTHYDWKDIDQAEETSHPMQFWFRAL